MFKRYTMMVAVAMLGMIFLGISSVNAQATRVGFTDHEVLIAAMPDYAEIQAQLQQEFLGAQEALQSLAESFQRDVEEYQVQQRLLTEERRAQREKELQDRQTELQEAATRKDEELAALEAELMQPIFDRVQAAIDEVAQARGLDIVLRHRVGAQPVILYVNPETVQDITLEVAKKLGIEVDESDTATPTASEN